MAGVEFKTVPDELLALASIFVSSIKGKGYKVVVEPRDLSLPGTPLFLAERPGQTLFGLVFEKYDSHKIDPWYRYAQSCHRDTRICVAVSTRLSKIRPRTLTQAKKLGIGLACIDNRNFSILNDYRDLAFKAELPDRKALKPAVRTLLSESYDRFEGGDWKVGFEESCLVLEDECRKYLAKRAKLGSCQYKDGAKTKTLDEKKVKKATLGALKDYFCSLLNQNSLEAQLCTALRKLNPDRIRQIHKRRSPQSEAALRRKVNQHMWLITNALQLFHA